MRVLVLVPTRELAAQVGESFRTYGRHLDVSVAVIYGGVGQEPQVRALTRGVDVVVATPGRLVDLMGQGYARLDHVEVLVLDEADHMLDLGFIPDVRRVLSAIPRQRQTLLFSATMPPPIAQLAHGIMTHPAKVSVTPEASTVEQVDQQLHYVQRQQKPALLASLLRDPAVGRALVFTRTKHGANRLATWLVREDIPAEAIHGNKSQSAREKTLHGFKRGRVRVLVATDLAARGIDVDDITHVFNFELPNVPETYVHRIGRTARAGATGIAISLCDREERTFLRDIERLIRRSIRVVSGDHRGHDGPELDGATTATYGGDRARSNHRSYARPPARELHRDAAPGLHRAHHGGHANAARSSSHHTGHGAGHVSPPRGADAARHPNSDRRPNAPRSGPHDSGAPRGRSNRNRRFRGSRR